MAALRLWVSAMQQAMFMLLRRFGIGAGGAFLGGRAVWVLSAFNIRWLLWGAHGCIADDPADSVGAGLLFFAGPRARWAGAALAGMPLALSGHTSMQLMVSIVVGLYLF